MGEGFFPPMKAFQRRNTSCISKRNNAERRGNARPDAVLFCMIPVSYTARTAKSPSLNMPEKVLRKWLSS